MAWRAALFHKVFSRYLLATNTVATAFLYGMGDCIQQKVFERTDQQHNWERTKRMAIMGLVQGPIDHYWFQVLEKRLPLKTPKMIAIKVVLGELVIGTSSIGIFFTGMNKLEGRSWKESISRMSDLFWPAFKMDLLVWPAAQVINFYYIPFAFRVIFNNIVFLCWSVFLSYLQHKNQRKRIDAEIR